MIILTVILQQTFYAKTIFKKPFHGCKNYIFNLIFSRKVKILSLTLKLFVALSAGHYTALKEPITNIHSPQTTLQCWLHCCHLEFSLVAYKEGLMEGLLILLF